MRSAQVCPKCQHDRIVVLREDNAAQFLADDTRALISEIKRDLLARPEFKELDAAALRIAITKALHAVLADQIDQNAELTHSYQLATETWICRSCGYAERYALNPEEIPADGVVVREIGGSGKRGPYR